MSDKKDENTSEAKSGSDSTLQGRVGKHDIETLEEAKEDAERVIDGQVDAAKDVNSKASDTLRYCILILSLLIGAIGLGADSKMVGWTSQLPDVGLVGVAFAGAIFIYGVYAIFQAAANCIEAFDKTETVIGPDKMLGNLDEENYTRKEWLYLSVYNARTRWIPNNHEENEEDADYLDTGYSYLKKGLLSLFAGVLLYLAIVLAARTAQEVG